MHRVDGGPASSLEGRVVTGVRCVGRAAALMPDGERVLRRARRSVEAGAVDGASRSYACDWRHFHAWALRAGFEPLPASPAAVAAYLAAQNGACAASTLRRRLAAVARVHRESGHGLDTEDPLVRDAVRGPARGHAEPPRQAAALAAAEVRRMAAVCGGDLAGLRDRALLLLGHAAALRPSELVGLDAERLAFGADALEIRASRSEDDAEGEGRRVRVVRGRRAGACPVAAVEAWVRAAGVGRGPLFRRVTRHGTAGAHRLSAVAVRDVLAKRAAMAGTGGSRLEAVSPRGPRAGSATQAHLAGARGEEPPELALHGDTATARRPSSPKLEIEAESDAGVRRTRSAGDWELMAKSIVKAELKRRNLTYAELAARLAALGFQTTEQTVSNKLNRGKFSAVFLLRIFAAIGAKKLRLT